MRMLLLPPSEGKAEGGNRRRTTWTPEAGAFGSRLGDRRAEVVEALLEAGPGRVDDIDPAIPTGDVHRVPVVRG